MNIGEKVCDFKFVDVVDINDENEESRLSLGYNSNLNLDDFRKFVGNI